MSKSEHRLSRQIEAAKVLRSQIHDLVGDDDEMLRDMIEGETGLHEMMQRVVSDIGETNALIEGLKTYQKTIADRKSRFDRRIESFRKALLIAMEIGEIGKSIEFPMATLTKTKSRDKVLVTNEADIPAEFFVRGDPKLDRKKLLEALQEDGGQEIYGAELSNGGETIRVIFR